MPATRSPFPGMDPWLEEHWHDVHHEIISGVRRQIAPQLSPDLFVTVEEDVYVLGEEGRDQLYRPDVAAFAVRRDPAADRSPGIPEPSDGGVAVAEPIAIIVPDEPITESYVEIRSLRDGHPLVTVVEVLSPTNKLTADGRAQYVRKRAAYRAADVNVVEVDLLHDGRNTLGVSPNDLFRLNSRLGSAYRCVVRRYGIGTGQAVDIYPMPLRERLPAVPIPLRPGESAVTVDLQEPIDAAYRLGGYARRVDYDRPPDPPLSPDDTAWAADRVAAWRADR